MMSSYYESKSADENDGDGDGEESESESPRAANIFESLPHTLRQTLSELNAIFADLKTSVAFDQNILVTSLSQREEEGEDEDGGGEEQLLAAHSLKLKEMCHDSNNKFMAYLLVNSLILGRAFEICIHLTCSLTD